MRDWLLELLFCLECGGRSLERKPANLVCPMCGTSYSQRDDVTNFLHRPHPTVVREREAVHRIDRDAGAPVDWMRDVLTRLKRGDVRDEDVAASAHIKAIVESRAQILDLFQEEPLQRGSIVLELGADVGWASSVLLDAGCRVIATDITDHLFFATDGKSPDLCRLHADMNRLPIADSTVDVVFAASCVHHSWDLAHTFREIARILKPGGAAYLCGEPLPSLVRFAFGGGFGAKERELGINETWIPRSTWLRVCRQAGLEPRIVFPGLESRQLKERMRQKRLPGFLAGVVRPVLPLLQVSVHLRADKAGAQMNASFSPATMPRLNEVDTDRAGHQSRDVRVEVR